jgi:DNA repair exonuclease SbcCD ATPase subunit
MIKTRTFAPGEGFMPRQGLLHKSQVLIKNRITVEKDDPNAGISPEDRIEITARIEELTRKSRITIDPERFILHPLKKGFLFPLAVNVLALLFIGGVLWGLSALFSERDARYSQTGSTLSSAEGKLLQELKKDSDSRLSEKEKEINDFQSRLSAMEKEQANLQSSFNDRLASREAELRSRMQQELQKEKERLQAEGFSEAVIQERLKKFEAEKLAGIQKQLADFNAQLVSERAAADAKYSKLKDEYSNNITKLNDERKRIQDESRKKEDALRLTMEAKTRDLENQSKTFASQAAQASAGLQQARDELAKITAAQQKASASEDQIIGLYLSVRSALQDGRYEEAAKDAASLQSFLSDPGLADIPSLQKRREADLFAADTMSKLAASELQRARMDNTLLLNQAEMVSSIRSLASRAKAALGSGNGAQADQLYNQALSVVPEVMEAYRYFTDRQLQEAGAKQKQADDSLFRARKAIASGNYPSASQAYNDAALSLGIPDSERKTLFEGIAALAVAQAASGQKLSDTRSAGALIKNGNKYLSVGHWSQSLGSYSRILAEYPHADQVPEALKGIDSAFAGLAREADVKQKDDEKRIAELQTQLSASGTAVTASTARISELETALEEARTKTASASGAQGAKNQADTRSPADTRAADAALKADIEKLQQENQRLSAAAKTYDDLVSSFTRYQKAEDAALFVPGTANMVEAKNRLDAFLSDPATRRAFPDLKERLSRYESGFIAAGQQESIRNAIDIADKALRMKDAAFRDSYLQETRARYRDNPDMQMYIDALKRGLK